MGCGSSFRTREAGKSRGEDSNKLRLSPLVVRPRGARRKQARPLQASPRSKKLPPGYAVLCAVDTYAHLLHLSAAVADAEALGEALTNIGFRIIVKLYNNECTLNALHKALRGLSLPQRSRLIVFFAGHGLRHYETGRTFYCTVNTKEDALATTAFDLETVFLLSDFLSFQQVWIFDFCFSGGASSSVVRRGAWTLDCEEAPSISIMTAGKSGEYATESRLLDTPLSSPMITPEVSPEHSPVPSPVHANNKVTFDKPFPVPRIKKNSGKSKGLFTNALVRALIKVHTLKRHRGYESGRQSLTQVFVNVRGDVHQKARTLGVTQSPQLNTIHWYRNKRTDGVFFF